MAVAATPQSLEDASNIASEFVYSLDNLPNEIKHYLEEIQAKDHRVQELQQQIDSDGARYVRRSLHSNGSKEPSPASSPSPTSKSVSNIVSKIDLNYTEIDRLSQEKLVLAERISSLLARTRSRLDYDLNKVRILQGEAPATESMSTRALSATPSFTGPIFGSGLNEHDVAASLSESLRLALEPSISAPSPVETRKAALATKRRGRSTSSPSIKLPPAISRSISPAATVPPKTAPSRSSRLSRQIHPPVDEDIEMADEDAEGDEDLGDADDGDDAEDDKLYCFCQKSSYGDMIACDNEDGCPYEWFHLSCVGLSKPLPDKWYCSVCSPLIKMTVTPTVNVGRKGRKK
ncbi:hypothetical protein BDP27DRAFT_1315029 [Rhodocollybia butyracea]|uniref:Chromatin modification-related protein n=1 Tax=Rhodocollybia butyracea TaxID=206335 RepID=A0A9P5Q6L7_9AGAR|nr:hypothetical protein BDP27DRAFT_1315029 [Rhodocollybia butyracea]